MVTAVLLLQGRPTVKLAALVLYNQRVSFAAEGRLELLQCILYVPVNVSRAHSVRCVRRNLHSMKGRLALCTTKASLAHSKASGVMLEQTRVA